MNCPFCAEEIDARATQCPACKERLDDEGAPPPKAGKSALTIVLIIVGALLVTCMGIGLLAALLMPALMKAKEKANRTKCANQLRQIGISAVQYMDAHRFFPHIGAMSALDGDVTTSDTPRAMRLIVNSGYIDNAEVFICPSGFDLPMRGPMLEPDTWQWGGTEAVHGALDPLADDPALDQTDELSYGWTRRGLNANARSNALITADRAVVERDDVDPTPMRGNHTDGWNVGQADATVTWCATQSDPFPGSYLTRTSGADAGFLSIKVQEDPTRLR